MFKLDAKLAAQDGASRYIDETGAYNGVFTQAIEVISSEKKTKGIQFTFKRADGAMANYLTVWHEKADGAPIDMGKIQIMGIMTSLSLKEIKDPVKRMIEATNYDEAKEVLNFDDFCNKPIGVFLQKEFYKRNGETKSKFNLILSYDAQTKQIAGEKLGNKTAERIEKMIGTVKDKLIKEDMYLPDSLKANSPDDIDDDIPF